MAQTHSETLLSNASATGSAVDWPGGETAIVLSGTVGGATITLQIQAIDDTWVTTGVSLTAVGVASGLVPAGRVRALVASGSPSGLYCSVHRVPS